MVISNIGRLNLLGYSRDDQFFLTWQELSFQVQQTQPSYTKLHLAIALMQKIGDPLNSASWQGALRFKPSRHMRTT
ncbi:hypothetical protein L6164_001586 [Bauhinia variegata]|uniref:Uncharacterized protein n=1 Tax=Bauhinia variegata TaxID=167791 RepID=A0ACB9QA01_BAUVA|nr:hypothetical protein L6164_001586 [Bauhinia variegata]